MNERMNEAVSECGYKRMNEASKRQSSGGDNFDELNKTLDSRSRQRQQAETAGGAEAVTEQGAGVGVAAAVEASVVKSRRARGFPQMRAESAQ